MEPQEPQCPVLTLRGGAWWRLRKAERETHLLDSPMFLATMFFQLPQGVNGLGDHPLSKLSKEIGYLRS